MNFPQLIREEIAVAASNVQFGGGGIGMPNNAPEAFDGTFRRLMLVGSNITMSNASSMIFQKGQGGVIPVTSSSYAHTNRYTRSFTPTVINTGDANPTTRILLHTFTSPTQGSSPNARMNFVLYIDLGTSGRFGETYSWMARTNSSDELHWDECQGNDVTAGLWEGLHLEIVGAFTFSGIFRLYGLSP